MNSLKVVMPAKRAKISRKEEYYYFRCNKCKRLYLNEHKIMRQFYHLNDTKLCDGKFERI
jgi:hypothetical protein